MTTLQLRYKLFLDVLRNKGEVNMFGAVPYLMEYFELDYADATKILTQWMEEF